MPKGETLEHGALLISWVATWARATALPGEAGRAELGGRVLARRILAARWLAPWSRDDFPLLGASIDHQHWIEELVQCLGTRHQPLPAAAGHSPLPLWPLVSRPRPGPLWPPARLPVIDASHHRVHNWPASCTPPTWLASWRACDWHPELYALRDQMLAQLDACVGGGQAAPAGGTWVGCSAGGIRRRFAPQHGPCTMQGPCYFATPALRCGGIRRPVAQLWTLCLFCGFMRTG